ncbi:MAG TPA: hypothetical protein VGZ73_10200 [Bryobacteraceae bacterium]|nr:hypothetical protein [Bryobacteraceae bacterium]
MEQSARAELTKLNVAGASIAIVRGGQVIFSEGFAPCALSGFAGLVLLVHGTDGETEYVYSGIRSYGRVGM